MQGRGTWPGSSEGLRGWREAFWGGAVGGYVVKGSNGVVCVCVWACMCVYVRMCMCMIGIHCSAADSALSAVEV